MDFSFFGGQAVEKVQRYGAEATKNVEVATSLEPSKVAPSVAHEEVEPSGVIEVQPAEATEVQPVDASAPPS